SGGLSALAKLETAIMFLSNVRLNRNNRHPKLMLELSNHYGLHQRIGFAFGGETGEAQPLWRLEEGVIAPVPGIMRLFWAFSSSNPPESPSQEESSLANMPDTLEARCRSDGPPAGPRSIDPLPGSRSFLTVSAVA